MKVIGYIGWFTVIAVKSIFLTFKLLGVVIFAALKKRNSKHYFRKQLLDSGIPLEDAEELTYAYGQMVNYNPFSYLKAFKNHR